MGDDLAQADRSCEAIPDIRKDIVLNLQRLLHQHNNLVQVFKTALERMATDE